MGQIQSISELVNFLQRRWMIIAVMTVIGVMASMYLALKRQPYYEAIAVIRVETPRVNPDNPSDAETSTSAAPILQGIEQRLTTRENLKSVIDRHGLFSELTGWSLDQKISFLRGQIRFEGIDSAAGQVYGQARNLAAILVYAQADNADTAARLANDFAQGILDQSSSGQLEMATESVEFFKEEEARLWAAITALEAEIAAFKNENANSLPGLQDAGRDELTALDGDIRESAQEQAALQAQIQALEAKENLRETDRRALADMRAQIAVLQLQIDQSMARRGEVAAAMARLPEVERVLAGFDRHLGQLQGEYEMVTGRMAVAQTSLRLAERGQDGRFTLLERAMRPENPAGGGRRKLVMAGTFAAFIAGLGIAFVLDLLKPVVRTSAQMQRQLGIRPVVTIPELATRQRDTLLRRLPKLLDDPLKLAAGLPRPVVIALGVGFAGMMTALLV